MAPSAPPRSNGANNSQHIIRNTVFFAGMDFNLQFSLAMVFCLYLLVTVGTFSKLPPPAEGGVLDGLHSTHNLVKRAKVLLHGKIMDAATTSDALKHLIRQEEGLPEPSDEANNNNNEDQGHGGAQGAANLALGDAAAIAITQQTFPLKAGDDLEEIDHPGLKYADMTKFQGPAPPLKMKVPRYWNPPSYGGDVRKYLGDYGKRLITPQEALSIGSKTPDGQETIYITIASYRDPECPLTIDSIFRRAKHPHRLKIAVIDQRMDEDPKCIVPEIPCEQDSTQTLCKYSKQIESLDMDARLGIGPVFARHLGYRHYRGEYFAMQVDAHVRFVEHWDESLADQWHSANNEMAVLSTYLSDLNNSIDPVSHKGIRAGRPIMCATDYEGQGKYKHLRHGQQPEGPAMIHGQPTLHPFWAAGFSFGRGHFVVQVPYDQYLPMIFQGEEISIGLRGFSFGYDYYTPEKAACFHMYAMLDNKAKRDKVPHFWENTAAYKQAGVMAMQRLNGIIGMGDPKDVYDHAEEHMYALGSIRPKEKFFSTFGIHTESQTVEHHLCQFVGQPMQRLFLRAMRNDQMGLDYTQIDYEWVDPHPDKKK